MARARAGASGSNKPGAEELRKRLDRIGEIFGEMVGHADTQSRTRCPYRDRRDRCTAHIRCRHQLDTGGALVCTHDGAFDYRLAWESRPDSRERAKRRIRAIRERAEARRKQEDG